MAVTEFAILHTLPDPNVPNTLNPTFLSILRSSQTVQEKWYAANVPRSPSSIPARGTWGFQQLENPADVLLTARWTDVAEHYASINSPENQAGMAEMGACLDASSPFVLLHLEGEIFSPEGEGTSLLESPVISVARLAVAEGKRAEFEKAFEGVREILAEAARPHRVRSGWRVDGDEEAPGEFVMFCGWESREAHGAFARSEGGRRFGELDALVEGKVDVKHYKRIL